jgi:hypothetical protein
MGLNKWELFLFRVAHLVAVESRLWGEFQFVAGNTATTQEKRRSLAENGRDKHRYYVGSHL